MAQVFTTTLIAQRPIAHDHYEMILSHHPAFDQALPGQFIDVQVSSSGGSDPLLRRPFSLYRRFPNGNYSLVYRVVGRGTAALAKLRPGDSVNILGPLGRGFSEVAGAGRVALVGGGVGVPPVLFLAQHLHGKADMKAILGFGTGELAFGASEFADLGVETTLTTVDGSLGRKGMVTEPLNELLAGGWCEVIYACGPKPMLAAVAALSDRFGIPAQLSFEESMACGVGACLSCVLPVKSEGGVTYHRVCNEGPVFDSREVVFDA